jgi:hypothetical protein
MTKANMDSNSFSQFLQPFETNRVFAYLQSLDLQQLVTNPYFLSGSAIFALVCLWMRWRLLLVVTFSSVGFIWLLSYTLSRGTSLEGGMSNETLLLFVGGCTVLVFLVIYVLFIRND